MSKRAGILLILLIALAVRIAASDWSGLSADEANGVAIAVSDTWQTFFQHLKEDGNPPLFYALVRLFSEVAGSGDVPLRMLGVFMSTLFVVVVYAVARAAAGNAVGLVSALMVALCPTLIRFTCLVRMYWLLPFLSLLSTYLAVKLLAEPDQWRWRICYALSLAAMVYTHHWGFIVALAHALVVLVGLVKKWWHWRQVLPWLCSAAAGGMMYLPWLPVLFYVLTHDESPWAMPPSLRMLCMRGPAEALVGPLNARNPWQQLQMIYAAVVGLIALLFSGKREKKLEERPRVEALAFMRLVVIVGLAAVVVLSSVKPAWRDRYLVAFTPMWLICLASCAGNLLAIRHPFKLAFASLALLLPIWVPQYLWLSSTPESSVAAVSARITKRSDPTKDLVVVSWESLGPSMDRSLPPDIRIVNFPDLERVKVVKWEGMNQRIRDDARMEKLYALLSRTLNSGGSIWLIDSAHATRSVAPPGKISLAAFHFLDVEEIRMDQVRTWLDLHAVRDGPYQYGPGRDLPIFLSHFSPAGDRPPREWPGKSELERIWSEASPESRPDAPGGRP